MLTIGAVAAALLLPVAGCRSVGYEPISAQPIAEQPVVVSPEQSVVPIAKMPGSVAGIEARTGFPAWHSRQKKDRSVLFEDSGKRMKR